MTKFPSIIIFSPPWTSSQSQKFWSNKTHFHLSYNFGEESKDKLLNFHTDREECSVKYQDLDVAVQQCLDVKQEMKKLKFDEMAEVMQEEHKQPIYMGKSDIKSAFHLIPLSLWCWLWLIMAAFNPRTNKLQYFIDKCLPFGASISCAIFQRFSNALKTHHAI